MSKNKRLIGLCLAVLCSQDIYAQPQVMSLEELFRLADENSRSIQIHDIGKQIADEALAAAKAQRLPEISASLSAGYLGNGRLWDRDFSNGVQAPMPHFSNNFALEARQVIYAGGAVDSGIEMAALDSRSAELDRERSRQDVRFLLVGCYLDLYRLHNQIRVLQQNISLTEQLIAHMEARNREGAALKNDITRYELQRETQRLQLTQAENARAIANYRLATTLHLPTGTEILPDTAALSRSFPAYAGEEWQAEAAAHNLDLQQARLRILRNEQQVRRERSARLPQIAIVAADHLDGPVTIEVPPLDNNFNYWHLSVGLSYNLSSLYKNNRKLRSAKLDVSRAQVAYELAKEETDRTVQENYLNWLTACSELQAQEKSVELANENYRVVSNRYANDLALLTDLIDAGNVKLDAELKAVNARIQILFLYYKMKYVAHTL